MLEMRGNIIIVCMCMYVCTGPWQEIPGYSHLYPDQRRFNNASSCGTRSRFGGSGARFCRAASSGIIDRGMTRSGQVRTIYSVVSEEFCATPSQV